MRIYLIIIQIASVSSNIQMHNGTDKLKLILNQYIPSRRHRCLNRNVNFDNITNRTVRCLVKKRFDDVLDSFTASECEMEMKSSNHLEQNLGKLLIHEVVPKDHWDEYKTAFDKTYLSFQHEMAALAAWRHNLEVVAEHNRDFLSGKRSYSLQLNHFGDWHVTDYVNQILRLISTVPLFDPARDHSREAYRRLKHYSVPRSVDWRSQGFRPRREEQWHCGACYAFAVAHALQAQLLKRHKDWEELSPQQIVDCSYTDGNRGCRGGSLQAAFRYAARVGLAREIQYPYLGRLGHCHYSRRMERVRAQRWATLPAGDEAAVERAVATIGPLAVAVNAAPVTFQLYRNGIYDDPLCVPGKMNHAMLLVGYTPQYWILLNWWGRGWGKTAT